MLHQRAECTSFGKHSTQRVGDSPECQSFGRRGETYIVFRFDLFLQSRAASFSWQTNTAGMYNSQCKSVCVHSSPWKLVIHSVLFRGHHQFQFSELRVYLSHRCHQLLALAHSPAASPVCFCREEAAACARRRCWRVWHICQVGTFFYFFFLPFLLRRVSYAGTRQDDAPWFANDGVLPRPRAELRLAFILPLSPARSRRRVYSAAPLGSAAGGKRCGLLARSVSSFDFSVDVQKAVSAEGPTCRTGLNVCRVSSVRREGEGRTAPSCVS